MKRTEDNLETHFVLPVKTARSGLGHLKGLPGDGDGTDGKSTCKFLGLPPGGEGERNFDRANLLWRCPRPLVSEECPTQFSTLHGAEALSPETGLGPKIV